MTNGLTDTASGIGGSGNAVPRRRACRWRAWLRFPGWRRAAADSRGSTLIEFAVVAPLFLTLLLGTFEVALTFFMSGILEGAVANAARQVRTGQTQQSADPMVAFRTEFCDSLFNMIDCTGVVFDVRNFTSFGGVDPTFSLDANGNLTDAVFQPGGPGDIVVVRAAFRYSFTTPLVGNLLSGFGDNKTLLMATAVFRSEPFEVGG